MEDSNHMQQHLSKSAPALGPGQGPQSNGVPAWVEVVGPAADSRFRARQSAGSRYGYESEDDGESDGGLFEYARILRRHKTAIVLSGIAGLVLGVGIGIPMKPVFRARTSLEVLNVNEDFMNMKQSSPTTTTDTSYDTSEEQTQAKLIEGHALQQRVLAKLDPGRPASRKRKMATAGWRQWLHLREKAVLTEREKLLSKLADSLKVVSTPRTRVLEVTVDSTDPKLAADYANTLLGEFVQQNAEARLDNTHTMGDWLRREIDGARENLKRSEDALQAYARESGLIFTDENTNVATEKLQQMQQQLSTATADRIAKQSHFELAKSSPPDALADVLNDDRLHDTESKLNDLRSQVASLSAVFTPGYSKLRQAQAELATIQSTFDQVRADIITHIENDYHEAARREDLLAAAYDAQTRAVTGQDEKAIQYNILKREVESSRQLYDTMLQQTKQASIASALHASNVRVVDPAEIPDLAVFPNFKLNAALGLFGGIFLSMVMVTIRERADRTLQEPGEVKLWTNLTELGAIPSVSSGKVPDALHAGPNSAAGPDSARTGSRALRSREQSNDVALATWQQKAGLAAEAFRCTLTSLLFVGENGSHPHVLVVTSANAGDGKTSVVSNLALATAEIRRKVLIVDADLRRPRMHDIYNLPNDRGLSDILREELTQESLTGLIHQTCFPNLHVLPAGPSTEAAAHLLYSPNFAALIARFRTEYDMILIDAPPTLHMTDARVAARLADGVVLVSRAGKTTRDALLAASDRFLEDRINIIGTILNDWNPKKAPRGYYGYGVGYKPYHKAVKAS
jgi:capsular exopolysaccharide synthesis family protein